MGKKLLRCLEHELQTHDMAAVGQVKESTGWQCEHAVMDIGEIQGLALNVENGVHSIDFHPIL